MASTTPSVAISNQLPSGIINRTSKCHQLPPATVRHYQLHRSVHWAIRLTYSLHFNRYQPPHFLLADQSCPPSMHGDRFGARRYPFCVWKIMYHGVELLQYCHSYSIARLAGLPVFLISTIRASSFVVVVLYISHQINMCWEHEMFGEGCDRFPFSA